MRLVQHYKGGIYVIIDIAKHTETGERLIIYKNERGEIFARPLSMFYELIEFEGEKVPRFKTLGDF